MDDTSSVVAQMPPAEVVPQASISKQLTAQQRVALGPLLFTSDFECGNMGRVERLERTASLPAAASKGNSQSHGHSSGHSHGHVAGHSHEEYVVTIAPDCAGTPNEVSQRTWFYFGISLQPKPASSSSSGPDASHAAELVPNFGDVPPATASSAEGSGSQEVVQDDPLLLAQDAAIEGEAGMTIDLVVRNMNNQAKLFREGYKPWWRSPSSPLWKRLPDAPETAFSFEWGGEPSEGGTGLAIRWRAVLESDGTTYFAFCAPFGPSDCERLLGTLEERLELSVDPCWPLRCISVELQEEWVPRVGSAIYFHRQQLGLSLEGRAIDLLTITSAAEQPWDVAKKDLAAATLDLEPDALGSDLATLESAAGEELEGHDVLPSDLPAVGEDPSRCFTGRPLVFLSARVHPGETPGQFAFLGLLRFLLSADPRAEALRERFVFKLVPMLNPDGVALGHHRTNSRGLDLNRCYTNPTCEEHEGVWLAKRILSHWSTQKRLLFCVDFHGHPSRRGCFLLGNKNSGLKQTWNIAFARLCQLNSPHFDIDSCDFEDRAADDGHGDVPGKHGTARAAIHRDCQVCHVFTFEANFHSGRSTKPMTPVLHPSDNCPGGMAKTQAAVPYDKSCWAQAGEAIGVSLLDVYGHNCHSRLPASRYGSLSRLLSLSPSFNSHRGQYGPPDDMPQVLGATYTSVFQQQLPCKHSLCCWHANQPKKMVGCPVSASTSSTFPLRPPGNFSGSQASTGPRSASQRAARALPSPPLGGVVGRRSLNFADVAPAASSARPPLPTASIEVQGGKQAWGPSYKTTRRQRKSHGGVPSSAPEDQPDLGDGTVRAQPAVKASRRRASRTVSAGALIVASTNSNHVVPATTTAAPGSSHQ